MDRKIFDIDFRGILIQSTFALLGFSWMYALTRRRKLSILAALPPLILNLEYAASHYLCAPLDVFVGLSKSSNTSEGVAN